MEERALEDGHSFLMADVLNRHQNEDFLLDLKRRSRHPKVERDNLGWGLGQNAAFPHGLGVVLVMAVEDRIDGPAVSCNARPCRSRQAPPWPECT